MLKIGYTKSEFRNNIINANKSSITAKLAECDLEIVSQPKIDVNRLSLANHFYLYSRSSCKNRK